MIKGMKTNRSSETAKDLRWSDHTVWHIMRNPNYTGDLVQCRYGKPTYKSKSIKEKAPDDWIVVEGTHEAIVSKEDYDRVQTMKADRGLHNRNANVNRAVSNIFSGVIKCKLCGRSLVLSGSGQINRGTKYLRCAGRKSGIVHCTCAMVKYSTLAGEVAKRIHSLITRYADFERVGQSIGKNKDSSDEVADVKKSISKNILEQERIGKALSDSYVDKSSGVISGEDFAVISAALKSKTKELVSDQKHLQEKLNKLTNMREARTKTDEIIARYQNFTELNRDIVQAFVEAIYIGERDRETNDFDLEIHWKV